jgi:hypothetical protein
MDQKGEILWNRLNQRGSVAIDTARIRGDVARTTAFPFALGKSHFRIYRIPLRSSNGGAVCLPAAYEEAKLDELELGITVIRPNKIDLKHETYPLVSD